MKKALLLGTLLLGLSACRQAPVPDYPYNPGPNTTPNSDARIPYRGDWVFVIDLSDDTKRYGVASILTKFSDSNIVNGGGGVAGWCLVQTCTQPNEQGTILFGSASTTSGPELVIGMSPRNSSVVRFVMTDLDDTVSLTDGKATIAGTGLWTNANGSTQGGVFAFVQVSTTSSVTSQQLRDEAVLAAQRVTATKKLSAQQARVSVEAREAMTRALMK